MSSKKNADTSLMDTERKLIEQEQFIINALKEIKKQKIALEVEQAQLMSLISASKAKPKNDRVEVELKPENQFKTIDVEIEYLDEPESSMNTAQLDLTVKNNFHQYSEAEDSENDDYND